MCLYGKSIVLVIHIMIIIVEAKTVIVATAATLRILEDLVFLKMDFPPNFLFVVMHRHCLL